MIRLIDSDGELIELDYNADSQSIALIQGANIVAMDVSLWRELVIKWDLEAS